jgi:hypothetical protein
MTSSRSVFAAFATAVLVFLGGCATPPPPPAPSDAEQTEAVRALAAQRDPVHAFAMDKALEDRILALDPKKVTAADVRDTLSKAPAPRVFTIRGGIYPVYLAMESFGAFLMGMGYPEDRILTPHQHDWSLSPYQSADEVAGLIAWCYEHEGVRPTILGHSQGGIQAVKVLHVYAGDWASELHPYNPLTSQFEARTTIVDPLTGRERPVLGFRMGVVQTVGTGGWALILPNHWMVVDRVRTIPDTVEEFVGYRIGLDLWALDSPALDEVKAFHANGTAVVRNVWLPDDYKHVMVPATRDLATNPAMRAWLDDFVPDNPSQAPLPQGPSDNVMFAANVWYELKKHWAIEAQRFVRARRGTPPS